MDPLHDSHSHESENQPLEWSWVERKLITSSSYWLVTVKPDGSPHARPVWGVYHDGTIWFSTGRSSVKGRNLAHSPKCVLHVESADDVVIIDGSVEQVCTWDHVFDSEPTTSVMQKYMDKYVMSRAELSPEGEMSDAALYRVWPRVVNAWLEGAYPTTQSHWVLHHEQQPVSGH